MIRILSSRFIGILCIVGTLSGVAANARESSQTPALQNENGDLSSSREFVGNSGGAIVNQVGISPKLGEQLPLDREFVDSSGKRIRLRDCFASRPVILHLVYYECPMLCKLSADGLLSTLSTFSLKPGEDFSIVTISFDPREGPQLSARARDMAIARCGQEAVEKGWHFLTGDQAAIDAVTEAVGFRYIYDEKTSQYAHASGVFVVTSSGTISRYLSGVQYSPRDLRLALVEASDGKVGTAADQVLLLCYMYDPTVGKYGFAIMTVMRVAGLVTVVTLAASIYTMVRRERRRNQEREAFETEMQSESGWKA